MQWMSQSNSKASLAQHKRTGHEGITYQCSECDHQSTSKGYLVEHKRAVYEGVKYQCSECDHKYISKENLTTHKRARHVLHQWNGVLWKRKNPRHWILIQNK